LHDTKAPTIALAISTIVNFVCNLIGMHFWGAFGIAGSTSISAAVLTVLLLLFLKTKHEFRFYLGNYINFLIRYLFLILVAGALFLFSYIAFFKYLGESSYYSFFYGGLGYWFLVFPLAVLYGLFVFFARKLFGIKLYFLSK
jgi:peptidoglycan biosynthesis protein MviN/MurJ (putative lipid II flippase)